MARYFMHLRDSTEELLDPEGHEYSQLEVLRCAVLRSARDVMSCDVLKGRLDLRLRIDAHDETGTIIYSLPFKRALSVNSEGDNVASLLAL